jgi:hypothetical protein
MSDESISCPHCAQKFPLEKGISRQTIEKYESEFQRELDERTTILQSQLRKEAEEKLTRSFSRQIVDLKTQITEERERYEALQKRLPDAQKEAAEKALAEFQADKQALEAELKTKELKLADFRTRELELRADKKKLEESRQELEITLQRRLDEERRTLEESIRISETERFKLVEAEYRKKIEDAQKTNEELRRKLEQGSQQLQGEVLELELEGLLERAFPVDEIEPVRKGLRGADLLQIVRTRSGQVCGRILWEAKRAEHWSDKWIQKLKDDQQEAKAELAVIVTTALPKTTSEPFFLFGDVWVVSLVAVRPVAETLRTILLETEKMKLVNTGKNEKLVLLYDYLTSPQFGRRIRAVVDAFRSMKHDLDQEQNAMQRIWKKRETQIERVAQNMMGMCGELQGIAHDSIPQLAAIAELPAPDAPGEISHQTSDKSQAKPPKRPRKRGD